MTKQSMPPPPEWTLTEPEKDYHAKSKSGECMSSGMLKKFRECPYLYHQTVTGKVVESTSTAFRFGRAVHKICLEGIPAFNRAYAIGGPINEKTGKSFGVGTKAHDEWLAAEGKTRDQVINDTIFRRRREIFCFPYFCFIHKTSTLCKLKITTAV